ncbi:MAG TPA: non-ribosomal peptide synthetase, partial [Anaerolineae bacterium]|nr:non-ribosomal peptide synthetase [Anaerolineae bacterium]
MTQSGTYDQPTAGENNQEVTEEEVFVFPVSFAQQRLWFLDQFEPGSPFYNIPSAVRLTGKLDVVALERTLNEIVRRHESLRTTFATINGDPVQVISPSLTLPLPVIDLRDLPQAEREAEALRLATGEAMRPFNLTQGPLLRGTLLRLDEEEHIVLLTMHHIISDGWSMGVFIGELTTIYE